MLVPVIGLVQVGEQSRADRHTYLSEIGLVILLTWLVADLSARLRYRLPLLAGLSAIILAALSYGAQIQTGYWKNSEILWVHALSCTPASSKAVFNLGTAYEDEGRLDDAITQYEQALTIKPSFLRSHHNLANALRRQGRLNEAIAQYQEALKYDQGQDASDDYDHLGRIFFRKGQMDNAIAQYQAALKLDPGNADACNNFAGALLAEGRLEEAAGQSQAALKIQPHSASVQSNLARILWMLARSPGANTNHLLALAENANQMTGGNSLPILRALAAAYARCGHFPEAVEAEKRALAMAANGPSAFVNTLEQEVALYQSGSPLPLINQTNPNGPR
jgi:tetratricopeptide (TPR) repeat protein